jgi:S-formylglutathione hydrolase
MHDYVVQELPAWSKRISRRPTNAASAATPWAATGAGLCAAQSGALPVGVGVLADQQSDGLPWGQKAFSRYLGEDRSKWREWDACALMAEADEKLPLLVDQGDRDDFWPPSSSPKACNRRQSWRVIR